jgi:hypothetical protein
MGTRVGHGKHAQHDPENGYHGSRTCTAYLCCRTYEYCVLCCRSSAVLRTSVAGHMSTAYSVAGAVLYTAYLCCRTYELHRCSYRHR